MAQALKKFFRDESGATAIEYALLGAMLGIGSILAFTALGGGLGNLFGTSSSGAGGAMENAAVTAAG